jgi:hypothetical protein
MIANTAYAKYKEQVVAGYVMGNNEAKNKSTSTIETLCYSKKGLSQVQESTVLNELTADFGLVDDRLWLPSIGELRNWNILSAEVNSKEVITPNILEWSNTAENYYAWLRNPDPDSSDRAWVVRAETTKSDGKTLASIPSVAIGQEYGVSPAIHLDIEKIDEEYADYLANPAKGGWWSDDWLKALFMTVCIIGTIGIILVISAVVAKARRGK